MTKTAFHCYRHASRLTRRVLRSGSPCVAAAVHVGLVSVVTLAPVRVGVSMASPMPVIQAAEPLRDADMAIADAVAIDPLANVVAALDDCPSALSSAERQRIARIIRDASAEHGYDPLFITALVQVESGCVSTARGNGAVGLVQLLPATARDVARRNGFPWRGERTLTEPASNIQLGLTYLGELEEQLGDTYRAVAAFNLGPARVAHMSSSRAQRTVYVRKVLSRYEELLDAGA
jgi:soluble lytic murein transglycosylase-like protein